MLNHFLRIPIVSNRDDEAYRRICFADRFCWLTVMDEFSIDSNSMMFFFLLVYFCPGQWPCFRINPFTTKKWYVPSYYACLLEPIDEPCNMDMRKYQNILTVFGLAWGYVKLYRVRRPVVSRLQMCWLHLNLSLKSLKHLIRQVWVNFRGCRSVTFSPRAARGQICLGLFSGGSRWIDPGPFLKGKSKGKRTFLEYITAWW